MPATLAEDFAAAIESQRRALKMLWGSIPRDEPWPVAASDARLAPSLLAARTFSIRCRRVPSWVGPLGSLEDFAATWDAVFIRDGCKPWLAAPQL